MRTALLRSRAVLAATALLAAMSSIFAGATTVGALPRAADAVGIRAGLDVTVGAVTTRVDGMIGQLSGPPSDTRQVLDVDASLEGATATVTAEEVRTKVVSNALQSRAVSEVTGATLSVPFFDDLLGGTLVATGATVVRAEAICPADAAPTATVDPLASVMVAGAEVTFDAAGSASAVHDVADAGAGTVELQLDTTMVTTSTAAAAALTLDVTVLLADGAGSVTGTVKIADVSCEAPAAPMSGAIDLAQGPISGGTLIQSSGAGFVPGATTVEIGGNVVPASEVTVAPAGTSLTFLSPAHAAGRVSVAASTPDETTDLLGFRYVAPADPPTTATAMTPGGTTTSAIGSTDVALAAAPTMTALTPAEGPITGGTDVTVTGTGFEPDAVVEIGGVPATATAASGGTSLTFTTPPHAAGPVGVTVTTAGGTAAPALDFTYVSVPPTATGLDIHEGPATGGTMVVVTGTGFTPDATVDIGGNAVPVADVVVGPDGTSLTFTTPPHAAGAVDVTVTTTGGSSTPALGFTYTAVPPTATELDIHQGPTAGGTVVTITGTGLVPDETTVTVDGEVIPGDQVDVADDGGSLSFTTRAHDAGEVSVTVTTPGGTTSPPLTYTYASPAEAGTGAGNGTSGTVAGAGGTTAAGNGATGGRLATTGSEVVDLVVLALVAIGTGGTLLWSRRRALRHTAAAA